MTVREFNRWTRNWDQRLLDMLHTDGATYAWGKEKKPVRSRIIVLDPPLPKTIGPDQVQVEWFYTPIDARGKNRVWVFARSTVRDWYGTVPKETPVQMVPRMVGKGAAIPERFEANHRLFQEMVLAWDGDELSNLAEPGAAEIGLLSESLETVLSSIDTLEQGVELVEKFGLPVEEWLKRREWEQTERKIREVNDRYAEMMNRTAKVQKKLIRTPMDPILLIDGKYLLTGSVTGRTRDLFRMANWLIREQMERNPRHGFDMKSIQWDNKREPKRGEIIQVDQTGANDNPNTIDIEWFFTYITNEGQLGNTTWMDTVWDEWKASLREAGVRNVRIKRMPVAQLTAKPSKHWSEHQKVHQEMVMAWETTAPGWASQAHSAMPMWLGKGRSRAIGTWEGVKLHLDWMEWPADQYLDNLKSEGRQAAIRDANRRILEYRSHLPKRDRHKVVDPVLVIDGKYLIEGQTAGSAERVFQILNWLVWRIQQG